MALLGFCWSSGVQLTEVLAAPHGQSSVASSSALPAVEVEVTPSPEVRAALNQRLTKAQARLNALSSQKGKPWSLAHDSLLREIERLTEVLKPRRPACNPEPEIWRLEQGLSLLIDGRLFYQRPGVHRLAYRSPLDGQLHDFAVYLPASYATGKKRYPLVVMLHGMGNAPLRDLGRLFGLPEKDLRPSQVVCNRPQLAGPEVMVVAPNGFGDALYRVVGEVDVETVVTQIISTYRVDPRRVTITGLSMGGTGAVEIAMQHPHRYAGVLALCGYYDRFQDRPIQGQPLLPWERYLMTVHSPVEWALNGQGIPLVLFHGLKDGPQRAQRLEKRYQELGYSVETEFFPRGHDVWIPGYKEGRAFKILSRFEQHGPPKTITFVTGRPRIRRAYWLQIERFKDHSRWAEVNAQVKSKDKIAIQTRNVAALSLDLPLTYLSALSANKPISLTVDEFRLEAMTRGPSAGPHRVDLVYGDKKWQVSQARQPASGSGADSALMKRPGLSGPIEDLYFDPVLVVYGTGGGQARVLRAVAQELAHYRRRVTLRYPVLADVQLRASMMQKHALILVGNEKNNRVLARLGQRLPVRINDKEVRVGAKAYQRPQVGTLFIYPNPEAPDRYLLVVGGTTPRSYQLLSALPVYLPDYVVFDEGMGSKHPLPIAGDQRSLVTAGFFDESWKLASPSN